MNTEYKDFMTNQERREKILSIKEMFMAGKIGKQAAIRILKSNGVVFCLSMVDEWYVEKQLTGKVYK